MLRITLLIAFYGLANLGLAQDGTFAIEPAQPDDSELETNRIYLIADQYPIWPGCETSSDPAGCTEKSQFEFLSETLEVPIFDSLGSYDYTTWVEYEVDTAGRVCNVKCLRDPDHPCSLEAMYGVIKFPQMIPAKVAGRPVRIKQRLPIKFTVR